MNKKQLKNFETTISNSFKSAIQDMSSGFELLIKNNNKILLEKMERISKNMKVNNLIYQHVDIQNFLPMSNFYEKNTEILFRPATLEEIFLFGIVDINSENDVNHKFSMLLNNCVDVIKNGEKTSYLDVYEKDVFNIMYLIKEFTFINSKTFSANECECEICGKKQNQPYRATFSDKYNRSIYKKYIEENQDISYFLKNNKIVLDDNEGSSIILRPPTLRVLELLKYNDVDEKLKFYLRYMFVNDSEVNDNGLENKIIDLSKIEGDLLSAVIEIINVFEKELEYYEMKYSCIECKTINTKNLIVPNNTELFTLFQGDFDKILENVFEFFYQKNMQPSQLFDKFYFMYEKDVDYLNNKVNEENKQREKENQQQSDNSLPDFSGMNNIANNFKNYGGYKR